MSASTDPDKNDKSEAGQSLMPATEGVSGIDPFIAATKEGAETAPRSFRAKMLDYSAHAAIVVGLLGFTWTVSNHVVNRPAPVAEKAAALAPEKKVDELAELRKANAQMASDMKNLRANLDSLRVAVKQDRTPAQIRALEATLNSTKSESSAAIAQLSTKLDKLQRDPNSKMQQLVDRLGKLEHQTIDTTSTGSIGPAAATAKNIPTPLPKPASTKTASLEDTRKSTKDAVETKPQVIEGWSVRDVQGGVALIEGRRGQMEIVPGVNVPGAGVVKSIDRRGNGWTVTTSKGEIAYAAPQRDNRRTARPQREFYAPYGYGGYGAY